MRNDNEKAVGEKGSKITNASLYRMIAKHIPELPEYPEEAYEKWDGWRSFLGRDDICDKCGEPICACLRSVPGDKHD